MLSPASEAETPAPRYLPARPPLIAGARRPREPVVTAVAVLGVAWVAAFALATALVGDREPHRTLLADLFYVLPVGTAAGLTLLAARRVTGRRRAFWRVLAASNVLWLAGELAWAAYELGLGIEAPFPSVADAFYLTSYCCVPPAIVLGFPADRERLSRALLDASIMVVAVGVAGFRLLIEPQLSEALTAATLTGIAYPLLGVAILMVLTSLAFAGHRHVPASVVLVGVAFGVAALTDAAYTYLSLLHAYVPGSLVSVGWQAEAVLLCLGAVVAMHRPEREARAEVVPRDPGLPLVLAGVATTALVVVLDHLGGGFSLATLLLAVYVVVAIIVRLALTSHESEQVAHRLRQSLNEQERLAVTDGLTGLRNRRYAQEALGVEVGRALRAGGRLGLLVVDLDHFKRVNDQHGHPAGDRVLRGLATRLRSAARSTDIVARYGGEEFVVVLPGADPDVVLQVAERCRRAVCDFPFSLASGARVRATISVGAACLPDHATTADELVRVADKALYTAKELGRDQVQMGPVEVGPGLPQLGDVGSLLIFLENLADSLDQRQSDHEHSRAVARWATLVAAALGLDEDTRWRCAIAGRLHDIGKIAVPEAVLDKPGPLTAAEWRLVREHPRHGARLVALTPAFGSVAGIIAEHHERWDGGGYPAGKAGDEICVEARVLAVCDAWATMRADRPYRRSCSAEEARIELLMCQGSHFDPAVVAAFLHLEQQGRVGSLSLVHS